MEARALKDTGALAGGTLLGHYALPLLKFDWNLARRPVPVVSVCQMDCARFDFQATLRRHAVQVSLCGGLHRGAVHQKTCATPSFHVKCA